MEASEKQKWAIVSAAKQWYDLRGLKDLKLHWAGLNFYNLPAMTKSEASSVLEMLNAWSPDEGALRQFFEKWLEGANGREN